MIDHSVCDILDVDERDNTVHWAEIVPTLSYKIVFLASPCFTRVELALPLTKLCCYLPVGKACSRFAIERQGLLDFFFLRYYTLRSRFVSKMVRVVSSRE
ncbi:hypothetical protein L873DRAFT_1434329 [Choiromyces venosus 120613-1]|uniref:Uncharacterized protein n=1 Tax=Choiromyces venosus 120613-1 TaxID=1336337 RepID=A0A3N4J887_9PEZI|nr:hypothetical protein L873DRAFT_1434329 [Choiromyces venosus 120613-1]